MDSRSASSPCKRSPSSFRALRRECAEVFAAACHRNRARMSEAAAASVHKCHAAIFLCYPPTARLLLYSVPPPPAPPASEAAVLPHTTSALPGALSPWQEKCPTVENGGVTTRH